MQLHLREEILSVKYVAHAAVRLQDGVLDEQKNKWFPIKTIAGIEYRWRVCGDRFCEVVAGPYEDKFDALRCAKKMQVTLVYATIGRHISLESAVPFRYASDLDSDKTGIIEHGDSIFHTIRFIQRFAGPDVFEVHNSTDEIDQYRPISMSISTSSSVYLDLSDIDTGSFSYSREVHDLFQSIELAENAHNFGVRMTIYCGLLEHLATDARKDEEVQSEISELVEHVKESSISVENKIQLVQYLETGRNQSARQKCKKLVEEYAHENYGDYSSQKILDKAYSLRSKFSHGEIVQFDMMASYMKFIVLDVIKGYMCAQEFGMLQQTKENS